MTSLLQTILDSTQKLSPCQIRKLFYILSTLAFSQRQEGSYIQVSRDTTERISGCALVLFARWTSRGFVVQIVASSMNSDWSQDVLQLKTLFSPTGCKPSCGFRVSYPVGTGQGLITVTASFLERSSSLAHLRKGRVRNLGGRRLTAISHLTS